MRARVIVAGTVVVLAAAGSVAAVGFLRDDTEASSDDTTETATTVVPVELRTLKDAERLDGDLGYADEQTVSAGSAEGVLTGLPDEGSVVHRGEAVYDVNDEPVALLIGKLPLYRDLSYGVDDGADVRQLERNLEALGYDPGTVNQEFTYYTQEAVEDLQEDLGLEETGDVTAAQFLVLPDAIRVGAPQATIGTQLSAAAPTSLYDATSTRRAVTVDLDPADEELAEIGAKATVTLPDGSTVAATVDSVGTVATATDTESEDPSAEADHPGDSHPRQTEAGRGSERRAGHGRPDPRHPQAGRGGAGDRAGGPGRRRFRRTPRGRRPGGGRDRSLRGRLRRDHLRPRGRRPDRGPGMNRPTPVLEVRRLRKSYGDLEVLHGIDLAVDPGELVSVIGPSGSGKSTLLHIMGTLDRGSSGTVVIDGHDTATMSEVELAGLRAHRIGFVFQSFHLLEGLTALDNVAQGLLYGGVHRSARQQRAREMLVKVGLENRAAHPPRMLSGGERQRVAIARALLNRPAIVFADEPTGNLDTNSGDEVLGLLHELNEVDGTTIVVITHEHAVADAMRRQIEIRDGLVTHDSRQVPA